MGKKIKALEEQLEQLRYAYDHTKAHNKVLEDTLRGAAQRLPEVLGSGVWVKLYETPGYWEGRAFRLWVAERINS